jgi:uncharacterized RDD family membrane protein YckC
VAIGTARLLFREEMEEAGAKVVPHPSAPRQVCPTCQADYRKGDMFCKQCGTSLAPVAPARVVCTSCGTAVLLPARFCNACGQVLKDSPARGGAEAESTKPPALTDGPPSREASAGAPAAEAREGAAEDAAAGAEIAVAESAAAVSLEPGEADAPPANPGPPSADPASSQADVASPPRLPRALPDGGPGRSSALAEMARPSVTPAARPSPNAAPVPLGPRPAPAIVRARPDAGKRVEPHPASASSAPTAAGVGRRAVAGLLDGLLVTSAQLLLVSPVLYYWYENWWSHPPTVASDVAFWPILVSLILGPVRARPRCGLLRLSLGSEGATPGKRLLGLRVVAEDGSEPIGLSRAAVRVLGYLLSGLTLGIGFLMMAFGGSALHDRLAGTRVVRRERG